MENEENKPKLIEEWQETSFDSRAESASPHQTISGVERISLWDNARAGRALVDMGGTLYALIVLKFLELAGQISSENFHCLADFNNILIRIVERTIRLEIF